MIVSIMVVRTVVYSPAGGFCAADAVALELCAGASGAFELCAGAAGACWAGAEVVTAPGAAAEPLSEETVGWGPETLENDRDGAEGDT